MSKYSLPIIHNSEVDNSEVNSSDRFPVNKIICIGRNYADHAREMGHDPEREPPFFFFKPQSALAQNGDEFIYPHFSSLIFPGTPAGVGPVNVGDRLEARLEGFSQVLSIQVRK